MLRPPCHPPLTKILAAKAFQDFSAPLSLPGSGALSVGIFPAGVIRDNFTQYSVHAFPNPVHHHLNPYHRSSED
jgi:hypothetical protein